MKLGFNISIERKTLAQVKAEIAEYRSISTDVIELSLTALYGVLEFPFREIYDELGQFTYRSIHLPVVTGEDRTNNEFLVYPDKKLEPYLAIIKKIAHDLEINTFVVHPDQIADFEWANNEFGALLGFENMDNKKKFGKTVEDLQNVFTQCPQAKFICDLNHLYTNDKTMESSKKFHNAFKERLTHYHVSAVGAHHDTFIRFPNEVGILVGVSEHNVPMVHEGYEPEYRNAEDEYNLIRRMLVSRNLKEQS